MTTGSSSFRSATGATLSASFEGATGTISKTGFYYGTSSGALNDKTETDASTNGSFSTELSGLSPSTKYYYKAFVVEGSEERLASNVLSFTTAAQTLGTYHSGWLELPALKGNEDFFESLYGSGSSSDDNRNYSFNYSYSRFAALWVAYPLKYEHKNGTASTSSWSYHPSPLSQEFQVSVTGNSYGVMYGNDTYSKGHQCPNADRKSDKNMNAQTYYVTNQTPQIQEGFNGTIWNDLEDAERALVTSAGEVVYVVTGPAYTTAGGNETISYLTGASGKNANPSSLPIPNYYWKAFLKVKWKGEEIQSASAIGFWFEHRAYSSPERDYTLHKCSVDHIEQMTGFDLFTNLPGDNNSGIEKTAELNSSWTDFQNF